MQTKVYLRDGNKSLRDGIAIIYLTCAYSGFALKLASCS